MSTVIESIGNTPLIELKSLSEESGCQIFGKAEWMNPGGSVKDRAAKFMVVKLLEDGKVKPGDTLFEGTAGNTGIGLSLVAASLGLKVHIVMPNSQSKEKVDLLKALGATVELVDPCPFANPAHFYHTAGRRADEMGGHWINQFENLENMRAHLVGTAEEIWAQTGQRVDVFSTSVGTGGTLAGVSRGLKKVNPNLRAFALDPDGSGVHAFVQTGEFKSSGKSSVTEGIGIMRKTANLGQAQIDGSLFVSDDCMFSMMKRLATEEGLFLGPSAALNAAGTFELAMSKEYYRSGKTLVTIFCDSGARYASRFLDPAWLGLRGWSWAQ